MKNQKIPTGVGVIVILIITLTVGMFVWKHEKNQGDIQVSDVGVQKNISPKDQTRSQSLAEKQQEKSNSGSSDVPVGIVKVTSNINKWKILRDEENGIELKYPPELFINNSRKDIIAGISLISPEDAKRVPDAGIMGQFIVYKKNENIEDIIKEAESNNPVDFTQRSIRISGVQAVQITYRGAYAGELWIETLIKKDLNNIIIINYSGENQENKAIFDKILSTFKIL